MGCNNSKAKEPVAGAASSVKDIMPEDAQRFLALVNQKEPVATRLLEEWNKFVRAQETMNKQEHGEPVNYSVGLSEELWATTPENPDTHKQVDEVGRAWMHYVRYDLTQRQWGGDFVYNVAGLATQGFIIAGAEVDVTRQPPIEMSTFRAQIHYHNLKAEGEQ